MLRRSDNRPKRRQLIPNLFSNILDVVATAEEPLTQHEIVEALSRRLDRSDAELKRQVTVNLNDAIVTGYLSLRNFRYTLVSNRTSTQEPNINITEGITGNEPSSSSTRRQSQATGTSSKINFNNQSN